MSDPVWCFQAWIGLDNDWGDLLAQGRMEVHSWINGVVCLARGRMEVHSWIS